MNRVFTALTILGSHYYRAYRWFGLDPSGGLRLKTVALVAHDRWLNYRPLLTCKPREPSQCKVSSDARYLPCFLGMDIGVDEKLAP